MKIENKDYKKFYEEALERAKIKRDEYMRLDGPESYVPQDIEYIFPELAESEDDRIRKWLINEIKIKHHNLDEDNVDFVDKAIAWLEKQGEQKSAYTPEFEAGDWVINEFGFVMQIVDVQDSRYVYMYEERELSATIEQMENSCHRWTIQDAKAGDVLVTRSRQGDWAGIYKQSTENNRFNTYCFCNTAGTFVIDPNRCKHYGTYGLYPATKEQRDILFQKMKEAGYEWDAEKKELREIKSDSVENEKDDKVFKDIYEDLHAYYTLKANMLVYDTYKKEDEKKWEDAKKWLEEHKEHWKPTEEQLNSLLRVAADTIDFNARILSELYDDLKKL